MIINGTLLMQMAPLSPIVPRKERLHGVSYGLSEAGYDIRIKQTVSFGTGQPRFQIASTVEKFHMPNVLVGVVHDKSTWARRGLSVFNTVIEPGWSGWLTLELVYHGEETLVIPAGCGIAQVLFSRLHDFGAYEGKYQHQPDRPVEAILDQDGEP